MKSTTAAALIGLLSAISAARGQGCDLDWRGADGPPVVGYEFTAVGSWDPDGPRPMRPRLVAALLGPVLPGVTSNVVAWDPVSETWSGLGDLSTSAANSVITSFATLPDGSLLAAGSRLTINGGQPDYAIARWDGSTWREFAALGPWNGSSVVYSIVAMADGSICIGGGFGSVAGVPAQNIARWDGTAWHSFGPGANRLVQLLAAEPSGGLVASGYFNSIGGVAVTNTARWDGHSWSDMPTAGGYSLRCLVTSSTGEIFGAGGFQIAGQTLYGVARWSDAGWSMIGGPFENIPGRFGSEVRSLLVDATGGIVAVASFVARGVVILGIARWDGSAWSDMNGGITTNPDYPSALLQLLDDGRIAAGVTVVASGARSAFLDVFDGRTWRYGRISSLTETPSALAFSPSGQLYAAANALAEDGTPIGRVVRYDGRNWSRVGSIAQGASERVGGLAFLPSGSLIASGLFGALPGSPYTYNGLAEWNGTEWRAFGGGVEGDASNPTVLPNGRLLISCGTSTRAGGVNVSRTAVWTGSTWFSPPLPPLNDGRDGNWGLGHFTVGPGGEVFGGGDWSLFIGGGFTLRETYVRRLVGDAWVVRPTTGVGISALLALGGDNLVALGSSYCDRISCSTFSRWFRGGWSDIPYATFLTGIQRGDSGELLAIGQTDSFPNPPPTPVPYGVMRWDGAAWAPLGSPFFGYHSVSGIFRGGPGQLATAGSFTRVDGRVSPYFATYSPPRPQVTATVETSGRCRGTPVTFRASATGHGALSYRWQYLEGALADGNWMDLADGPWLISGRVVGLWQGTLASEATFIPDRVDGNIALGRRVRCIVRDQCADKPSRSLAIAGSSCVADFDDGSNTGTCDGGVTTDDLLFYLNAYANQDLRADLDDGSNTGTPDGGVTIDDLLYYLLRFEAGC